MNRTRNFIVRKCHMMTSYLQLKKFWTSRMQHRWKKSVDCKWDYVENKHHFVICHESIFVSQWTFQLTFVYIYIYIYIFLNLFKMHVCMIRGVCISLRDNVLREGIDPSLLTRYGWDSGFCFLKEIFVLAVCDNYLKM